MDNDFTEQVKAIRKRLKLSQAQLAEKLGVDKMTVSRWERGETRPSKLAQSNIDNLRSITLTGKMAEDKTETVTPSREDITDKVYPDPTFKKDDLPVMDINEKCLYKIKKVKTIIAVNDSSDNKVNNLLSNGWILLNLRTMEAIDTESRELPFSYYTTQFILGNTDPEALD